MKSIAKHRMLTDEELALVGGGSSPSIHQSNWNNVVQIAEAHGFVAVATNINVITPINVAVNAPVDINIPNLPHK